MLVVLPRPLTGNEQIEVRFALPMSGRIVTTKAKACWMRSSRTGVAVGLELQLDDEDRATIGYYVATLRRDSLQSGRGC